METSLWFGVKSIVLKFHQNALNESLKVYMFVHVVV